MKDFILELYENDNFTLYLTIALVVLVILFVLVLIFGKKDQKLEETKRLQKIELEKNNDAFKEENAEPVKLEVHEEQPVDVQTVTVEEEPKKEEETPIVETDIKEPKIEEMATESEENNVNVTVFEPVAKEVEEPIVAIEEPKDIDEDKKDVEEEQAPINIDDIPSVNFDEITDGLEKGLSELENIKKEFNSIELPSADEEVEKEEKGFQPSQVFSSVFVNKEQENEDPKEEKIESEVKIENDEKPAEPILVIQDDDDFDLPELKIIDEEPKEQSEEIKEEKIEEQPVEQPENETAFSFDDLIGETYNIK